MLRIIELDDHPENRREDFNNRATSAFNVLDKWKTIKMDQGVQIWYSLINYQQGRINNKVSISLT
jgi:hypothetical protein